MSAYRNVSDDQPAGRVPRRPPVTGLKFLHETPRRRYRLPAAAFRNPQFLAALLFGQGRVKSPVQPRVASLVFCRTPSGRPAVEVSYQA